MSKSCQKHAWWAVWAYLSSDEQRVIWSFSFQHFEFPFEQLLWSPRDCFTLQSQVLQCFHNVLRRCQSIFSSQVLTTTLQESLGKLNHVSSNFMLCTIRTWTNLLMTFEKHNLSILYNDLIQITFHHTKYEILPYPKFHNKWPIGLRFKSHFATISTLTGLPVSNKTKPSIKPNPTTP